MQDFLRPADGVLKLPAGNCQWLLSGRASTSVLGPLLDLPQLGHSRSGTPRQGMTERWPSWHAQGAPYSTVLRAGARDVGLVCRGQTSFELSPAILPLLPLLCVSVYPSVGLAPYSQELASTWLQVLGTFSTSKTERHEPEFCFI